MKMYGVLPDSQQRHSLVVSAAVYSMQWTRDGRTYLFRPGDLVREIVGG
jgi:hypothetical protein